MKEYILFFYNGSHQKIEAEGFEIDYKVPTPWIRFHSGKDNIAFFNWHKVIGFSEVKSLNR